MKKRTKPNSTKASKCPIFYLLEIVGDKWTLLIVRDLLFKEKKHYGDFLSSPEKISTNILADRLAKLERSELVEKSQDEENLARFVYSLTPKGKDLLPVLLEMAAWSAKHDNLQANAPKNLINGAPNNLLKRLRTDRDALIKEILSGLD